MTERNFKNITMIYKLAAILALAFLISFTDKQEEKEYAVKMSFQDWNIVVLSINSPDDVTKNQKAGVVTKIATQINKQLQDTVINKK